LPGIFFVEYSAKYDLQIRFIALENLNNCPFFKSETRGKQATDIVREIRQRAMSMSIGQSPFTGAGGAGRPHKNASRMSEEDAVMDETTALLRLFTIFFY
jgi:hypothetical protein